MYFDNPYYLLWSWIPAAVVAFVFDDIPPEKDRDSPTDI